MTLEAIRTILQRRPFEAVQITMSSGAVFDIRHPEMAVLAKSAMIVVFPYLKGGPSDKWEFLSYLHIAHIETLSPAADAGRAA